MKNRDRSAPTGHKTRRRGSGAPGGRGRRTARAGRRSGAVDQAAAAAALADTAPGERSPRDKELAAAADRAGLRVEVAKQNVRLAKAELKKARKRYKEAKREVKRARKRAQAARKAWKRARRAKPVSRPSGGKTP